ncbi:uncharacterized protein LOC120081499 [Benincasa hispida]|uniref:uncharacterized protein LOC120081499 n=1 Tax=Benincasa hispida TaxID=102211 RepID=UPI0018FF493B|nr:uncharacterized protein LOC120081499 [Benincasa hispida]
MGQALWTFGGKEWRDKQLRKITDRIFDKFQKQTHSDKLPAEDLYIATLLVYNEINKLIPGPHRDPPTTERVKERVKELIQKSDMNGDQYIDRGEFLHFILSLTSETFKSVSQRLSILTLVVAPTVAVVTKKSTEAIPGVGKLVQKLPVSAYAFLVTLAALIFQKSQQQLLE